MGRLTMADLQRIPHDPAYAQEAIDRWGLDALLDPVLEQPGRRGLGDLVAWITRLFGIRPCAACERRRQALNRVHV